jgi:hypothetical protein
VILPKELRQISKTNKRYVLTFIESISVGSIQKASCMLRIMNTAMARIRKIESAISESQLRCTGQSQDVGIGSYADDYLHHALDLWATWYTDIWVPYVHKIAGPSKVLDKSSYFWS